MRKCKKQQSPSNNSNKEINKKNKIIYILFIVVSFNITPCNHKANTTQYEPTKV